MAPLPSSDHHVLRMAAWRFVGSARPLSSHRLNLAVRADHAQACSDLVESASLGSPLSFQLRQVPEITHWDIGHSDWGEMETFLELRLVVTPSTSDLLSVEFDGELIELGVPECLRPALVGMLRDSAMDEVSPHENAASALVCEGDDIREDGAVVVWSWHMGGLIAGPEV